MQSSLVISSLLMGLAGGPHCIVMCGAACASIQQTQENGFYQLLKFQIGRLLGYAALGALAALSVGGLAWLSGQTAVLHPMWTFFHVLIFFWGLMLLVFARQPLWADALASKIWKRARLITQLPGGVLMLGVLWALMPCGLLYSALLVASLSGDSTMGALSMAAFAVGSSTSLFLGPLVWEKLKKGVHWLDQTVSMRLAGLLLSIIAGWAIWMDVMHQVKVWCVV